MQSILVVVHLFLAIGLVALILIQHGKGADMGAAFGSGASATVFGSRGASNFLSRSTAALATLFFVTSLTLAYFAMQSSEPETLMQEAAPAVEAPAALDAPPESDLPAVPEAALAPEVPDVPVVPETPAAPEASEGVPQVTE